MDAEQLASRIYKVEGFTVDIEYYDDDLKGYPQKLCEDYDNVATWKQKFYARYPYAPVSVLKGNGDAARGNMYLANLRQTYNIESLRGELGDLKDRVIELESRLHQGDKDDEILERACVTLGVNLDELTLDSIKHAYRRKVNIFAPDKIQHLVDKQGLHNEFLVYANRKTAEINAAYEQLKLKCELP